MEKRDFEIQSAGGRKNDDFLARIRRIKENLVSERKFSLTDVYRFGRVQNLVDCPVVLYNKKTEEKLEGYTEAYGPKIVDIKTVVLSDTKKSWLYDDIGNILEMTEVGQGDLIGKNVERIGMVRTKQAHLDDVGGEGVRLALWNKEKRVSEVYYIKKIEGKLKEVFLYGEKDEIWLGLMNIDIPNKDKRDLPFVVQKRNGSLVIVWKDGDDWKKAEEKVAEKNIYWNCIAGIFPVDNGLIVGEGGDSRLVVYKKTEGIWKKNDLLRNSKKADKVKYEDMVDISQIKILSEDGKSFVSVNQKGVLLVWQFTDQWVVKYKIDFRNKILGICPLTNNRFVVGEESGNISIWQGSEKLDLWNRKTVGFCSDMFKFEVLNDGSVVAYSKNGVVCTFSGLSVSGRFM